MTDSRGRRIRVLEQFATCARELHMGDLTTFLTLRSRDRLYLARRAEEYADAGDAVRQIVGAFIGG